MKDVDIKGKLHWSSKERWVILFSGMGVLAVSVLSAWWFCNTIPLRFLQSLWVILMSIMGLTGLACVIVAVIPKRTLWVVDILTAFWI